MRNLLKLLFLLMPLPLAFSSCIKMPAQSVQVMDALIDEGDRMHRINTALVNNLFDNKTEAINTFISKEYTPALVENFKSIAGEDVDFKAEFTEIMQSLMPQIILRKDSLQNQLNLARREVLERLNNDYAIYKEASFELRRLLQSAVRVKTEQQALVNKLTTLSKTRIDMAGIEKAVDRFINKSGDVGEKATDFSKEINSYLDKIQSSK